MPKTRACLYSVSLRNDSNIIQIISYFPNSLDMEQPSRNKIEMSALQ